MKTNFDTFRNLSTNDTTSISIPQSKRQNQYSSNDFTSRVSQNQESSFSEDLILENIQSVQSLGFNAIETF